MRTFLVRYRFLILALVGVALITAAVVTERSRGSGAPEAEDVVVGELGPTPGPDAEGYISEKQAVLERLAAADPDGEAAALVSASRLLRADEVSDLAGPGRVNALFVVFPGGVPEVLPVETTAGAAVSSRAAELDEDPECRCVYAFVLSRVTLGRLAELQGHPDTRLVDVPEPPVSSLRGWELTPLMPPSED